MNIQENQVEQYKKVMSYVRRRMAYGRYESMLAIQNLVETSKLSTLSQEEFGKFYKVLNEIIGYGLKDVLDRIWQHVYEAKWRNDQHQKARFYFSPGYYQYKSYRQGRPDTSDYVSNDETVIEAIQRLEAAERYKDYGFGYNWKNQEEFYGFRLTIWMRQFYEKKINNHVLYGFTKWLELFKRGFKEDQIAQQKKEGKKKLALKPFSIEESDSSYENTVVAIALEADATSATPFSSKDGILKIPIPKKIKAEKITETLNVILEQEAKWGNNIKPRHSLPVFGFSGYNNDQPLENSNKNAADDNYDKTTKTMSRIFGLLCDSIFNKPNNYWEYEIFNDAIKEIKAFKMSDDIYNRLRATADIIKQLSTEKDNHRWYDPNVVFNYYYALPLDESLDVNKLGITENVGTGNIYTVHEIPSEFLVLIKTWLSDIYSQVRLCEVLIDASIAGEKIGYSRVSNAFSHEVGKLGVKITTSFLLPLASVFTIDNKNIHTGDREWPLKAGSLSTVEGIVNIEDVSQWLICPTPTVFERLRDLFRFWGPTRDLLDNIDIHNFESRSCSSNMLLPILLEKASEIASIKKQMMNISELSNHLYYLDLKDKLSLNHKELIKNIDLQNISQFELREDRNVAEIRKCKISFIRCFLAMAVNTLTHADSINGIEIRGSVSEGKYFLRALNSYLKNPQASDFETKEDGTRSVLDDLASDFGGSCVRFGPAMSAETNNRNKWITEIVVPEFNIPGANAQWITF